MTAIRFFTALEVQAIADQWFEFGLNKGRYEAWREFEALRRRRTGNEPPEVLSLLGMVERTDC